MWIWVTLDQGQWMTLTFDIHIGSCTYLVNCIYQLWHHRLQWFLKNPLFYLFPIQMQKGPNLTLPLNRSTSTQGHHLNKLGSTRAPDAAYQDFYYILAWGPSWSCDQDQLNKLVPPSQWSSIWNLTLIDPVVSEEKMFKECGQRTDRRRTDGGLPIL